MKACNLSNLKIAMKYIFDLLVTINDIEWPLMTSACMQKPRVAAGSRILEYLGRCEILLVSGRAAATMLQRRGVLQGGKIGTFSEAFFSKSWIKIKQKFSGHL